jgi:uncharacterized protein (TIGR02145 family)
MTRLKNKYFLALSAFLLAGLCFWGCGDSSRAGASEDPNQVTASIEGVVEKGPFVKGTSVTLYELNPETFAQAGKVFTGTVEGDNGGFSLGKVELDSRYVLLEASGYYWNELWGHNTDSPLSLKAVAHVNEKSKVNINIGTHITHKRILSLIESGMDFDEAKEQAESELIKAVFGDDSGVAFENASIVNNDKLLALSVMVLKVGGEAEVTEIIADLTAGVTPELLLKLADKVALQYSYDNVMAHMKEKYPDATIGPFQAYIYNFWQKIYGLGECSEKTAGILDTVHAENSVNDGKILVCKEAVAGSGVYLWFEATDIDISVELIDTVEDGKLVKSKTDSTVSYVYDSGRWRKAYESEIKMGIGCVESNNETMLEKEGFDYLCKWNYCFDSQEKYKPDGSFVLSNDLCSELSAPAWNKIPNPEKEKELYFNKEIEYGSVKDSRDGKQYRTVDIAGKTWMAENLAYTMNGLICADSASIKGCEYNWKTALIFLDGDSVVNKQGICMDGWHIPDTTEWRELAKSNDIADLLSEMGWSKGKNGTGFSIAPAEYKSGAGIAYSYLEVGLAGFASSTSGTGYSLMENRTTFFGYSAIFTNGAFEITTQNEHRYAEYNYAIASVRCVKDSE